MPEKPRRRWRSTHAKVCLAAIIVAVLGAACTSLLAIKDPTLDDAGGGGPSEAGPIDAAIDTPIDTPIDAPIDAPIDTPMATCVPANCPFGCDPDTDACRQGKLSVFRTAAAFVGNGFGGDQNPINVRGGAAAKCLETHTAIYASLAPCDADHMQAVLHVSTTDSIPLMAGKYGIPTTAPVHRADDGVLVANNWNDLTDPNKALRAPPTLLTNDADGQIWTGANTAVTCTNWTSRANAVSGNIGFANRMNSSWLNAAPLACDNSAGLLCICWQAAH